VGWNVYREYALAAINSFLVSELSLRGPEKIKLRVILVRQIMTQVINLLVILNIASGCGLFDRQQINSFPYVDNVKVLIKEYQSTGKFHKPIH
jgi:hypothetical protein